MKRRNVKLYRWFKGGRWAHLDGKWHPVDSNGWLDYPGVGVHYTYIKITKREDYRKIKDD